MLIKKVLAVGALASVLGMAGCQIFNLVGGMAQNAEYQKLIQVLPEYEGLENQTVAVLVNADMVMLYENPQLSRQISNRISSILQQKVPGIQVMNPDAVIQWQFRTSQWYAMPYGDLIRQLNVDRVVSIEVYEYRLNPPGNSYIWEGVCAASIGVIERDGIDPDSYALSLDVVAEYPPVNYLTRQEAPRQAIELGLLETFIQDASGLFYEHVEAKYPAKYQGQVPR